MGVHSTLNPGKVHASFYKSIPKSFIRLQVAVTEIQVMEAIGEALAEVVDQMRQCRQYLQLYPTSSKLQEKVSKLYAYILNFVIRAESHYKKSPAGESGIAVQ